MIIKLCNFISFGNDVCIDVPEGVTLVRGNNGAGKSALLEAITYAIWGKARGTSEFPGGDHLVRDTAGTMSVGLEFSAPNQIKITRGRNNNTTILSVDLCGASQQFVTLDGGEKIINDIIGIGYDTFIKTAYFQQGKDKAFSELTSTESRKKVVEMLGLDRWQEKQAIASKKLTDIKQQVLKYKAIIDNVNCKLLQLDIDTAYIAINDAKWQMAPMAIELNALMATLYNSQGALAELSTKINFISAQALLEEEKQNTLGKTKTDIEEYSRKLWNLRKQVKVHVDRVTAINAEVKVLQDKTLDLNIREVLIKQEQDRALLMSYRNVLQEKKNTLFILSNKIEGLETQKTKLSTCGDVCPILDIKCDSLCGDNLQNKIDGIIADIAIGYVLIAELNRDISGLQIKVTLYENNLNNYAALKITNDELCAQITKLDTERHNTAELILATKANIDNMDTLMQNANLKHASILLELKDIQKGINSMADLKQKHTDAISKVALYEFNIKNKGLLVEGLRKTISTNEAIIAIKEKSIKDLDGTIIQYNQCLSDQCVYDILSTAFGPNGVPAMQIEAMKDQIEVLANNILQYGGQKLSVSILLKEPKKSGEGVKEVFKILVKQGDKEISLFRLSGGEAYWVDLSIRAALFLAWRSRNQDNVLDLLMIDEGIGKIDDTKRRVLMDVLKYLSTKVKRILIITHTDLKNLVDEFDNVITINKVNGASTIL
jgi:DNA repair exonuclease SbcCD ATPase subunit